MLVALPLLAAKLTDLELRARVARAALLAGLAFSNTKTALAHALSYPVTLRYGVAHGIACSFSLPMVMRGAIGANPACDRALQDIFGADLEAGAERLAVLLAELGGSPDPGDHGIDEAAWRNIVRDAFAGARGKNYIGAPGNALYAGAMGRGSYWISLVLHLPSPPTVLTE